MALRRKLAVFVLALFACTLPLTFTATPKAGADYVNTTFYCDYLARSQTERYNCARNGGYWGPHWWVVLYYGRGCCFLPSGVTWS